MDDLQIELRNELSRIEKITESSISGIAFLTVRIQRLEKQPQHCRISASNAQSSLSVGL